MTVFCAEHHKEERLREPEGTEGRRAVLCDPVINRKDRLPP